MQGESIHATMDFRERSVISNRTGCKVVRGMTVTRSCTVRPTTGSLNFNRTRSKPSNLLSISGCSERPLSYVSRKPS